MLIAYTDGASRGNPGESAYGVRVCDAEGVEVARFGDYLGHQTNNYAEYQGAIAALRWALDNGVAALEIRSDSQLLVRQIEGRYRVKSEGLIGLGSRVTISGHVHGDLLRGESGSGCSLVVGQSARHRLGCGCSRLVSWQPDTRSTACRRRCCPTPSSQ